MRAFLLYIICLLPLGVFAQQTIHYKEHIVKKGETLFSIGRKYDVPLNKIKKESEGTKVKEGEKLLIPSDEEVQVVQKPTVAQTEAEVKVEGEKYEVQQGETLFSIAKKHQISVNRIKKANGMSSDTINLGQVLIIPPKPQVPAGMLKHQVQKGETLFSLSKKYHVTLQEVKEWNLMTNDTISIGQELFFKIVEAPAEPIETEEEEVELSVEYQQVDMDATIYFDNSTDMNQAYALGIHKSIPVGTVVKVVNQSNYKQQYVRIIKNKLTANANHLVLNKVAYDRLEVEEQQHVKVKMTFLK